MGATVFMLCFTLHNIEEALWLTKWRQRVMPGSCRSPHQGHFVFAVTGITMMGYLAAGLHLLFPSNWLLELCYIGCVGAMLINAVAPHLLLTIKYQKYCLGVLTGCLLLLPVNTIILYQALVTHLKIGEVLAATVVVGLVLLAAIPVFERIAKYALKDLI